MKNITKSTLTEDFMQYLEANLPTVPDAKRRDIAYALVDMAYKVTVENTSGISELYQEVILDSEAHKKQFRDHIELIQMYTKQVLSELSKSGCIRYDIDPKTRKRTLIAKTKVIQTTVEFMNALNDTVNDFYENVYKIELDDSKGVQTSLF